MLLKEKIETLLDNYTTTLLNEHVAPAVKQLETQYAELLHENAKLKFELDDYKAIVSELRIYEICWNKFKNSSISTESTPIPRIPLDELAKLAVFKTE